MPRKIRQLISELTKAGFTRRPGKGSHRKFYHPKVAGAVVISGQEGDDAKAYQERLVAEKLKEAESASNEAELPKKTAAENKAPAKKATKGKKK